MTAFYQLSVQRTKCLRLLFYDVKLLFFGLFQWTIKHLGLDAVMNYGCEFEVKNKKKIESLFAV